MALHENSHSGKGESADTKMALCSLHRRRDARLGGDGAVEGLNVGG